MEHTHVIALEAKHAGLDELINEEYRRPSPDAAIISRLKKEKLKIKEMLTGR
jgi:hypothetical protein